MNAGSRYESDVDYRSSKSMLSFRIDDRVQTIDIKAV